jgi:hypothetical protein
MRRLALFALLAGCVTAPDSADPIDGVEDEGKYDGPGTTTGTTLVLKGTVITMDEARGAQQVLEGGAVVIEGGKIKSVLAAGQALPSGSKVTVMGGSDWVISPGLINLHNHHAYNTAKIYRDLPLYENTYQWRDEDYYSTHIQYPKKVFADSSADATEFGLAASTKRVTYDGLAGRYSEIKELVSGTTSTQGSYFGTVVPSGYGQHLLRNVDWSNFGQKKVSQTALGVLVDSFDPRDLIARMDRGDVEAWLVHLLEGTDQESRDEFECLKAMGLVRKELVIVHGTALTGPQLAEMAKVGAKLVASPLDNLLYYGQTPDMRAAWKAGVNVSIGTDWSPAGSKNLLAELKVLDTINRQAWRYFFSDRDMVQMVTSNPADAINWGKFVGRIRPGLHADIAVFRKRTGLPAYRSIIDATEKDVKLVLIGGDPLHGDVSLMEQLKPTDHEALSSTCGFEKAIDVTTTKTSVPAGKLSYAEVRDILQDALQFDKAWMAAHWDPARGLTGAALDSKIKKSFPMGLAARQIDPLFVCEDPTFIEEVRTDPNVRTAFNGLCIDLRKWYGSAQRAYCGTLPQRPDVLTTEEHPGNVPQRPAAWCAEQLWTGEPPTP